MLALVSVYIYIGSSKGVFLQTGVIDNVVNVLNISSDANVLMKTIGCLRLLSKTDGMFNFG